MQISSVSSHIQEPLSVVWDGCSLFKIISCNNHELYGQELNQKFHHRKVDLVHLQMRDELVQVFDNQTSNGREFEIVNQRNPWKAWAWPFAFCIIILYYDDDRSQEQHYWTGCSYYICRFFIDFLSDVPNLEAASWNLYMLIVLFHWSNIFAGHWKCIEIVKF